MARTLSSSCPAYFLPLHDHHATPVVRSSSRRVRGPAPFSVHQRIGNISPARRQYRDQGTRFRLHLRAQTEQQTVTPPSLDDTYRLTLSTAEARKSVRFREIYDGDAMRIVVDAVAIGSEAEQEGVRPGQRLLSVSDPIRTNEDWEVGPNTSLSRVRDAIQFRRPTTINFLLSHASVEDDAGWSLENAQRKRTESDESKTGSEESSTGESNGLNSELLANITGSDEQTSGASNGAKTVAERLEEQQRSMEADGAREQAKLKARQQKRREYMDRESGRNDAPFFALLLSFFVLPAAVILLIAFSSGYLDTIADSYRRF